MKFTLQLDEKKNTVIFFLLICLALILVPFVVQGYWLRVVTGIFMFATITCALNFIAGFAGYAAFGNVVFMGIGAYTTAILMVKAGVLWWIGVIAGAVLSAAFAILLGLPILRLRGHYFAICTLGVNEAVKQFTLIWENLTEGGMGITLPLSSLEINVFNNLIYFIMFGILLACFLSSYFVSKNRIGYALRAIRANEDAAEMSGIRTTYYKIVAWAISAFFTGLIGGVYAYWFTFIEPANVFDIMIAVKAFVMMMLGGAGTVLGPILGATVLELVSELVWGEFLTVHMLIFGGIIILVVLFLPSGIMDVFRKRYTLSALIGNLRERSI
jgi:branched-chain amino acid transport system permease protein